MVWNETPRKVKEKVPVVVEEGENAEGGNGNKVDPE